MKNLKLIFAATLILIGFTTNATIRDSVVINNQKVEIKLDLSKNLNYPDLAKANLIEGTVAASILTLNNGHLRVLAINGHPMLVSSVRKQIETMQINEDGFIPGKELCVKINFEIE